MRRGHCVNSLGRQNAHVWVCGLVYVSFDDLIGLVNDLGRTTVDMFSFVHHEEELVFLELVP